MSSTCFSAVQIIDVKLHKTFLFLTFCVSETIVNKTGVKISDVAKCNGNCFFDRKVIIVIVIRLYKWGLLYICLRKRH